MIINKAIKEKIYKEFIELIINSDRSITEIRKSVAKKNKVGLTSVRRITNNYQPAEQTTNIKENKKSNKYPQTYIFTSWEIRVGIDPKFIDILKQLRKYYSAKVYISPVFLEDAKFAPPQIIENFEILTKDLQLNSNLQFKYNEVHALCQSPLSGWDGTFKKTTILPGLIRELKSEPSVHLCKQIISAGSLGNLSANLKDYEFIKDESLIKEFNKRWKAVKNTRQTGKSFAIAKEYIEPCALIVDIIDNDTFLTRYVSMPKSGILYDKNLCFQNKRKEPKTIRPELFMIADFHSYYKDEKNFEAVKDIAKKLNPKIGLVQDFVDFDAINYHNYDDFAKIAKLPSLETEIKIAKQDLKEITNLFDNVIWLESNHENFLYKFLKNEHYYKYRDHYALALKLRLWQMEKEGHLVQHLLELDKIPKLKYISGNDNLSIFGVTIKHGHEELGGRRLGFKGWQRVYGKHLQGHLHSPSIFRGSVCVGTSSKLDMSYKSKVDSWLHAHALLHEDGSIQLLPVINGKWSM
jgi:hypothetical protein